MKHKSSKEKYISSHSNSNSQFSSIEEGAKFFRDWLEREPIRAGEPANDGREIDAFLNTLKNLAEEYKPSGVIVKK